MYEYNNISNITLSQTPNTNTYMCISIIVIIIITSIVKCIVDILIIIQILWFNTYLNMHIAYYVEKNTICLLVTWIFKITCIALYR